MMDERDAGGTVVVVPAAGKGLRMGGERKQFRTLDGKPLLYWSVSPFDRHRDVDAIVIAAPEGEVDFVGRLMATQGIRKLAAVVPGGSSRQHSVQAALAAVPADMDVVLVHDAVRPFIDAQHISAVIETIGLKGAAALAIPVVDTLRTALDMQFGSTIPRDRLYRMQTPQGAKRAWMEKAFEQSTRQGWQATDDVDVLQRAGFPVQLVEGSSLNMKITTREDWELARLLWPDWARAR